MAQYVTLVIRPWTPSESSSFLPLNNISRTVASTQEIAKKTGFSEYGQAANICSSFFVAVTWVQTMKTKKGSRKSKIRYLYTKSCNNMSLLTFIPNGLNWGSSLHGASLPQRVRFVEQISGLCSSKFDWNRTTPLKNKKATDKFKFRNKKMAMKANSYWSLNNLLIFATLAFRGEG